MTPTSLSLSPLNSVECYFFLLLLSVSPSLPSDRNIFGASAKTKFCAKIVWTIKKWHHKWFAVNVILKKGILTYYMTLVGEQQHCVCLVVCRTNEKKVFILKVNGDARFTVGWIRLNLNGKKWTRLNVAIATSIIRNIVTHSYDIYESFNWTLCEWW